MSSITNNRVLEILRAQFSDSMLSSNEFRGELSVVVKKEDIARVCDFLKHDDELRFDLLEDLCGVDMYTPTDRFQVVYHVFSLMNRFRLRLKVLVDEGDLKVPTVSTVWSTANWHEREAYDMFGIIFEGHPDLRRLYMPDEFEYFPLRKDFPLMGIPGSLSLPKK
ncbi:MAG: NADH-quinone oxidoreductase subunit C [Bacteroidota bacterium]